MLTCRFRTTATLLIIAAGSTVSVPAGELDEREAPLYAAAILYAAHSDLCTAEKPCCYSVGQKPPSPELVKALQDSRHLTPIPRRGTCTHVTLDAWRTSRTADDTQTVSVAAGGHDLFLVWCTYVLHLTSAGWVVDPSKETCPVT